MDLYAIRRRNEWKTPEDLEKTAAKSTEIGDGEMSDQVRWIRSYVVRRRRLARHDLHLRGGQRRRLRDHAKRVGMPADEITPIADTVIVRPDPEPATRLILEGAAAPRAAAPATTRS